MQIVYFTIAGILLYLLSDRLLNWIETRRGARFEHRSLIFFVILFVLAVGTFQAIQHFLAPTG